MKRYTVLLCALAAAAAGAADIAVGYGAPARGGAAPAPPSDATLDLYWDNGSPGTGFSFYTGAGAWAGNDFSITTLSSYNYIVSARVYQYLNWPNGSWSGNLLAVYAFGGGTPGTMMWGPQFVRGSGSGGWQTYNIGWSLGSAQSFVVALNQLYNYPGANGFTLDTGSNGGHSWYYYNGVWGRISSLGYGNHAFMLRCAVDDTHYNNAVQPATLGRVKAAYY